MAQVPRGSGLLNLRNTSPVARIITAANASSPFLHLPAELKVRICDYVLGGHCIHITRHKGAWHHRTCSVVASDTTIIKTYKFNNTKFSLSRDANIGGIRLHQRAHLGGRGKKAAEAALIPYTTNTFAFQAEYNYMRHFDDLMGSMITSQKASIQSLLFESPKFRDPYTTCGTEITTTRTLKRLRSLTVVTESKDFFKYGVLHAFDHDLAHPEMEEFLDLFKKCPLTTVSICVCHPDSQRLSRLRKECFQLEQQLLKPRDEAEHQGKRDAQRAGVKGAEEAKEQARVAQRSGRGLRQLPWKHYGQVPLPVERRVTCSEFVVGKEGYGCE